MEATANRKPFKEVVIEAITGYLAGVNWPNLHFVSARDEMLRFVSDHFANTGSNFEAVTEPTGVDLQRVQSGLLRCLKQNREWQVTPDYEAEKITSRVRAMLTQAGYTLPEEAKAAGAGEGGGTRGEIAKDDNYQG